MTQETLERLLAALEQGVASHDVTTQEGRRGERVTWEAAVRIYQDQGGLTQKESITVIGAIREKFPE